MPERIGEGCNIGAVRCFNGFILQTKIVDIPLHGVTFTWSNNREKEIWARLDIFLLSLEMLSGFPKIVHKGLPMSLSNHNPILLGEMNVDWGPSPFRFYNWWLEEKIDNERGVKTLSLEQKLALEGYFRKEEVMVAITSCDGNKAFGPDGLNLNFIKANWGEIEQDFTNFIKEFHKDGSIVKDLNHTFIAIVPKVGKP
ncbi:hypothetical protein Dsin_001342 [Dipteronia sinensis]|uniref:Uncharacterized protein n=1 Tax=Dipteronia sinensis TaxID=43782 RepID=A0AAE0EIC8_9ROSI|nr:hypothetical protein Dsin_001342 [Dipteronia sinensis]